MATWTGWVVGADGHTELSTVIAATSAVSKLPVTGCRTNPSLGVRHPSDAGVLPLIVHSS